MVSVSQSTDGSGLLSAFVAIAVAFIAYYAYQLVASGRPTVPLPPGPRPLPLVGNLLGFPSFHPWETFSKWGETYGGIIHVSVLGQSIIVLNDARYAIDMLDRKGALYSDRPTLVMCGELIGWDEGPALSQFGDRWAEYRRFFSQFMGTKAKVEAFSHTLHEETNAFLKHLLAEPRKWVEHTQRFAGGFVLQLTYGYRASDPGGKELVKLVDDAMEGFSEATVQNAFLVDVIPVLRYVPEWFPGAAWKRKARMYHDYLQKMLRAPFELVKQQMAAGVARPSFTQSHLEGQSLAAEQERIIQWTAAGIYSGGADTTVAGIESFFLGITRHTDQQRRAQAELDAVLGFDCLPTLADRERLPYCEALYLEIMRCYTFGPLGLPHVVREDDVHDGYFIPKGSIIIPNNWKFFNNPKTYPQPKTFAPERFMGKEKQYDPRKYLFGYGRRTCPGIHLADASMWLLCMSVLALFDVEPPVEDGTPVVPPARFLDGAISHPEAFKCVIKPRSAGAEALVRGLSGNL
ncbi:cytochrome P450 [Rhodofomes roseus]|uniref:Cytochrome P450 n=1 Tax=Rhodofomes roseus TaxID=34475 RepID=A0ABQ8KRY6_9APHY|nr:cytochrome P450 [Rhodofomes roseus]KAH9841049.1 cytochrome P450 [Rhodofomes roseus]